jgi:hypothetical protein
MKKNKNMQSNNVKNNCGNNVKDCKKNNVSNKSNNKMNNKANNNIGFANETKSFELDENDEHSFELK